MRDVRWFCGCLLAFAVANNGVAPAARLTDFVDFSLPNPLGGSPLMPGRLYVPPEAAGSSRPFILFLHGAGESGSNNSEQVNENIDNLLAEAKRRGAYLYAPQTRFGWNDPSTNALVMTMVDQALGEHHVDAKRMYVTGLSMGGGGTWNFLNAYPDRWAAGVPICAVGPAPGFSPAGLLDTPIWAFHARNDGTVPVQRTRDVFSALLAANGEAAPVYPNTGRFDSSFASATRNIHYTEYYTGGHGIWTHVYHADRNGGMYAWMFGNAVPEPSALAILFSGLLCRPRRHGRGTTKNTKSTKTGI